MKLKHAFVLLFVIILSISLLSGCSTEGGGNQEATTETVDAETPPTDAPSTDAKTEDEQAVSTDEVTIKILYPWGQEAFDKLFKDIDEKLPNISLELVDSQAQLEPLQELNAKQIVPDIIFANWGIDALRELDMIEPLDGLIESHEFDLSGIDPSIIAYWRLVDSEGRLLGMPTASDNYALFYNKEVFDLFGVPYPTEDLTWDAMVDLAKKLTGERDGIQYHGLEMGPGFAGTEALVPLKQLNVNLTDPETGEVLITKEPAVTKYLELMKKFYSIPGIYSDDPEVRKDYSFQNKNVAMIVSWPGYIKWGIGDPEIAKHIQAVPVPVWPELPNIAPASFSHPFIINKHSEHKDEAFQVLAEYVSPEHQTKLARIGDRPVLTDPKVSEEFGAELEVYEGMDISAFFSREPAIPTTISKWDQYVDLSGSLLKFSESDMNIPEFLRVLQEESEAKIKDAMAKGQ
ncbi:extracellular solute-binding protein [Paenibacillus sp. p3-SID867]|uniref:ABC transporter substrate-binding protein n=1 Tax=Paenibacillus sp. p3-SID867 TaxID=2916363 RepID=UPI0021A480E0|nr:extracellular solute-binding protein [Paenibacillus sp. p3-SID867]MCT1398519.1 extracellular solute-binding protein [Paenibacillus sp. p3-SID867]